MSLKRRHDGDSEMPDNIFRSRPIEDRSSKFIGYYSPTLKPKELQSLPEIKDASHRILGWRRESNQQSINKSTQYVTGSDDDGEKYGGKKVEKVLESTGAVGACVVARYYGGVMLGPVRFTHMEDCAREAIREWENYEAEQRAKRRKTKEEEDEKIRLAHALSERDKSIAVLRALAAEKERTAQGLDAAPKEGEGQDAVNAAEKSSHATAPDYDSMSLDRLRVLDKARDATLSFLLKRIDKAEADLVTRQAKSGKPP